MFLKSANNFWSFEPILDEIWGLFKTNIFNLEYDYMIAREHINSIFNLISIIKYKYKNNIISDQYLPFKVRVVDFNLFYNVTLKK